MATDDPDEVVGINTVDELAARRGAAPAAAGVVTMDRLFTPWRLAYVNGDTGKDEGCVFCDVHAADAGRLNYVLHRGRHWYVMLNRYPYNSGHLLLVLTGITLRSRGLPGRGAAGDG